MKKGLILSTLLLSTCLLGASRSEAATSNIKAENKKVTVTSTSAKRFKDSTLKSYSKVKKGTVYQVDGYRTINKKHYYRLYQTNSQGKKQYRGYIVKGDTKELKMTKVNNTKYIGKNKATLWNDLYFAKKKTSLNEEKVYFTKGYYTLGDGKKYYSLYQKDKQNKDKWCGYTYSGNLKPLKMIKEVKQVTLTKNYSSWNDLYFAKKKESFDYKKGVAFETRGYYTIGGKKFYSLNQHFDAEQKLHGTIPAKDVWCGYMNANALQELKKEKAPQLYAYIDKLYNTYYNLYFQKKYDLKTFEKDNEKFTRVAKVDGIYTLGNGKKYASIAITGAQLSYINTDALIFDNEKIKNYYMELKDNYERLRAQSQQLTEEMEKNRVESGMLEDAKNQYDEAKTNYDTLKEQLDNNKKQLAALTGNTFTLNSSYISSIKLYQSDKTSENSDTLVDASQSLLEQNTYHSSDIDRNVHVDIKNIDDKTMAQLAVFANEMANSVRKKLGSNRTEATAQIQAVTKQLIKYYNDDNWDAFGNKNGHDTDALHKIMKEAELNGYGEEMGSSILEGYYPFQYEEETGHRDINNLDFLKFCVYNTMKSMLFDDATSRWGHAIGLSGVAEKANNTNPTLMGFGIDKYGNTHFFIADGDANKGSKITDQNQPIKNDNEAKIQSLKETVTKQEKELQRLQRELNEAKEAYQQLKEKDQTFKKIEKELDNVNDQYDVASKKYEWLNDLFND